MCNTGFRQIPITAFIFNCLIICRCDLSSICNTCFRWCYTTSIIMIWDPSVLKLHVIAFRTNWSFVVYSMHTSTTYSWWLVFVLITSRKTLKIVIILIAFWCFHSFEFICSVVWFFLTKRSGILDRVIDILVLLTKYLFFIGIEVLSTVEVWVTWTTWVRWEVIILHSSTFSWNYCDSCIASTYYLVVIGWVLLAILSRQVTLQWWFRPWW